eukprot:TRINITY_DN94763_c0_g1_i1.p1 TRINITY_DN94763_c0_g1~~TRINITY_DN94763_c0_g1_i1.p1  ORF type:complete len:541 (+),score=116.90 TRINITY_DN94763_c0_g1_i1:29-1624(+)
MEPGVEDQSLAYASDHLQARFIVESSKKIEECYDVDRRPIGRGGYGSVNRAVCEATEQMRAVKSVLKSKVGDLPELLREMEVIKMMDHPNIEKVFGAFQDDRCLYLVLEFLEGGTLGDRLQAATRFTESQTAVIMAQVLSAVSYIHDKGFVHRDIKPDNFMFQSTANLEQNTLKLIDFGLSRYLPDSKHLESVVGSAAYVAPEVLNKQSGKASDLWSCGTIMYLLINGTPPFSGMNDNQILQKAKKGEYRLSGRIWEPVSMEAKELIRKLLHLEPTSRCTAEEALSSEWLASHRRLGKFGKDCMPQDMLGNFRSFSKGSHLKKAALVAVAHTLSKDEVDQLQASFLALDKNGDGILSIEEIRDAFYDLDCEGSRDLEQIIAGIDVNRDGEISYTEFLAAAMDQNLAEREDHCRRAFNAFDLDGSGTIDPQEFQIVLDDGEASSRMPGGRGIGFEDFRKLLRESQVESKAAKNEPSPTGMAEQATDLDAGPRVAGQGQSRADQPEGRVLAPQGGYGFFGKLTRRCLGGYPSG